MVSTQEFAYGWVTPALAYGVSVLGSLLGLVCASRAREGRTPARRAGWLTLAAISIGGTGIWLMHFLGMLGFAVNGTDVRYTIGLTVLSAVLAIVVVGVGLAILGTGEPRVYRVSLGGLFTGLGVAGMHYTGMAAMRVRGTVGYDPVLVVLSIVVAVVAATAALWFTIVARDSLAIAGAALIMGVAVNGMHYIGMYALQVKLDHVHDTAEGVDLTSALPITAGVAGIVVVLLLYATLTIPADEDAMLPVEPYQPTNGWAEPLVWAAREHPETGTANQRATTDTGAHRAPEDVTPAKSGRRQSRS